MIEENRPTEPKRKKRKVKSIEERLKELELKEQKLNNEKAKLMEQKKEQQDKINEKKKMVLFKQFKDNVENWDQLSEDEVSLLCEEIFSKFNKEINAIL